MGFRKISDDEIESPLSSMETHWARKQQKLNNTKSCIHIETDTLYSVSIQPNLQIWLTFKIQMVRTDSISFMFSRIKCSAQFMIIMQRIVEHYRMKTIELNWIQYYAYALFSPTSMKNGMQFILLMPKHTNIHHIHIFNFKLTITKTWIRYF